MSVRACTSCGCTHQRACLGGCFWMPSPLVDVCSACSTPAEFKAAATRLEAQARRQAKRHRAAARARRQTKKAPSA